MVAEGVEASTCRTKKNENYQVLLVEGSLELRKLSSPEYGPEKFPEKGPKADVTCVDITPDILIFGTARGNLHYYHLDETDALLSYEYCHCDGGIKRIWANPEGTRVLFEDDRKAVYLHNPFKDQAIPVPVQESSELESAMWDESNPSIFVLWRPGQIFVYLYAAVNIHSSEVTLLQSAVLPSDICPTGLNRGALTCQSDDGQETIILPTHTWATKTPHDQQQFKQRFEQMLSTLHLEEALADAVSLKSSQCWEMLVSKSLEHMNVEVAVKACQHSGNIKLLTSLRELEGLEDFLLLRGHILSLIGDFDAAEESFLKSSRPEAAVELRRDLEHWDQAIALAKEMQSPMEAEIAKKYALLLEKQGDYRQALSYYEEFLKTGNLDPQQRAFAQTGIARTSIRLGDIWKGKHLVTECGDSLVYRECAKILEGLNLHEDAAELYVLDGQLEKAIGMYLDMKNFSKALSLLKRVDSPKCYTNYARALEAERKLTEAAAAYVAAEDFESAVRLYLGPLRNPTAAFSIVRKARSMEGARLASRYCKNKGDYENAIEFLVLQKRTEEARELAQQQDKMDVYTERVADVASEEECSKLGKYYEAMGNYEKATAMFEKCGDVKHALKLYMSWGTPEAMEHAISMVGRQKDEGITGQLLDFLTSDLESSDKCSRNLFRLHMVIGNYEAATKAALLIAQKEQESGNYKIAHQQLLDLCRVLKKEKLHVPYELSKQLMLLHSYTLVKTLIRLGDHKSCARLLIRVAMHISNFPAHVVPILISTVIECHRSGLKRTAFEYATMLMRPEYRNQITSAYKRKIESIVRKPEKTEEEETLTPCPFCKLQIPETQLECPSCRNDLPFCIASGRHLTAEGLTCCPACKFPALLVEFTKLIEAGKTCPMCHEEVALDDIVEKPLTDI
ncbi:hypothetical protein R1flu_008809 [Riccia fluitans]|uniref:WD repeat-containing protein 19 n=1 Tax=Riccia fluitans TaxID=41844 RepID=A0ABD1XEX9_9MARC